MTGTMLGVRNSLALVALVAGMAALTPWAALAQQPSKEATDTVRSNCRSDYMAKCMSVKPGGIEAIQCLKKNDASLSAACRSAVAAIKLPGETPAAAPEKPAAAAPAPAPQPAPSAVAKPAEPVAVAPAKVEAPKPVTTKPVAAPKPVTPKPVVATAPTVPVPAAVTPPPAPATGPKLGPLMEARLVRNSCTVDFQVLCKGVKLGEGRAINCLAANQPALSPNCKQAIAAIGR